MSPYQEEKDGIVSLTDAGVKEIQAHKNFYSDATKPIPREKRDWHTKDMAQSLDRYYRIRCRLPGSQRPPRGRYDLV